MGSYPEFKITQDYSNSVGMNLLAEKLLDCVRDAVATPVLLAGSRYGNRLGQHFDDADKTTFVIICPELDPFRTDWMIAAWIEIIFTRVALAACLTHFYVLSVLPNFTKSGLITLPI